MSILQLWIDGYSIKKIAEIKELEESEVCKIIKKQWGDL
jgi:hypothetical protein